MRKGFIPWIILLVLAIQFGENGNYLIATIIAAIAIFVLFHSRKK